MPGMVVAVDLAVGGRTDSHGRGARGRSNHAGAGASGGGDGEDGLKFTHESSFGAISSTA